MWRNSKLRLGGGLLAGLLGLVAVLLLALHTSPARRYVLKQLVSLLAEQGVNLNASALHYNLLDLTATMNDVVVRSRQSPDLAPLARADRIRVDLDLPKLLTGAYYLENADLLNPAVHIVIDENGRDNLPHPPSKESGEIDYLIRKFQVTGGSLRFEDRRQQIDATLPGWWLAIDGNPLTKDHQIHLEMQQAGNVSFQQRSLPIRELIADVLLRKNSADIRSSKLTLRDSTIFIAGKLDNLQDPRFDFKVDADLALESLSKFAGVRQRVNGRVHAALTATGPLSRLVATARLDGQSITVEHFDKLDVKAETTYDAAAQRIQIGALNVQSPAGAIQGKGSLALNSQAGGSTWNSAIRGLDLERVSKLLQLPIAVASIATGDVAAHWPGLSFDKAAGEANLRLAANRTAATKDMIPAAGVIHASAAGDRMTVNISSLNALSAEAKGQITLTGRRTLGGEVLVDAPDLASSLAGVEAFLGRELAGAKVAGALKTEAKLAGTVGAPAAVVTLDSADLQFGTLTGVTVHAAAAYAPSQVVIRSATLEWQDQKLTASGNIGLAGSAPALDLQVAASNVSIPAILTGAGRTDIPVAGRVSLDASVKGTTASPVAQLNLTAAGLEAYQEDFGALTATAEIANQALVVNQLRLEKPQPGGAGALQATGSYHFQSKDYAVNLQGQNLRLTSLTLPDGSPLRASLDIKADGRGSFDNPAGALQLSAGSVEYGDQQLGSVSLAATAANQQATIDVAAPAFQLTGNANVGIKEPYPATIELTANNTNLANLPVKIGLPIAGTASATIRGSGELQHYERAQATAEVAQVDITYNNQPIRTEGPLVARYENHMLAIDRAVILARDSRISLDGRLPLDAATGQGSIRIASTLNLESLLKYAPIQQRLVAAGAATIDGTVNGTLKNIDPNLTIALSDGFLSGASIDPPLSNVALRAQVRNGALEMERASADWGPATLSATGEIPFALLPADLPVTLPRRQGPAQFKAELNELDLAAFSGAPKDLKGAISARLEAQASRPELDAVTARLTFPVLRVGIGTYGVEQKGSAAILIANGTAHVEQFELTGPATDIRLGGTVGFTGARALDLRLDGNLDASIAGAFTDAIRARGAVETHAAVTGKIDNPQAQGYVQLADAQLSLRSPRAGLDNLNARLNLAGQRIELARLEGTLNGGTLSGGGSLEYANGRLQNTNIKLKADGIYLDFPQGLKTVSNTTLDVRSSGENIILGGAVLIVDGGFTDDLNIDTGILAAVTAPRGLELTEERSLMLENIRFDLGIKTENPIVVKNNLAKAEVTADLRLLGNPYEPGLSGRLSIDEGGVLTLNERKYTIERGNIMFTNERRIEPNLDILATTSASGFNITLQVSGTPGKTETTLSSDPPLPESDILAVLLTGKTLDEVRGQEFEVARNEVLSYLTGRVGSTLGRGIASATGLSMVRIEPNLIANETDPSARLTVGQDITNKLNLVYSMDLINSSDQIYVAEYEVTRRFSSRGVRQSDGSFRFDFRHDLRFGGTPEPKRNPRESRTISHVSILGNTYFSDLKIAEKLGVKEGKKYDFFKIRRGLDRINQMYAKENLLEANVRLKRDVKDSALDLMVNVDAGPMVELVYEGIDVSGGVRKRVREIWQSGVFDAQRAEESVEAIRAWLAAESHLQPKIEYAISRPQPDRKRVVFDIQPGPKFGNVEIVFEGDSAVKPETLRKIIHDQKLSTDVYVKPGRVTELLARYYQEQGYLDAKVETPRYELDAQVRGGKVVFPVVEGPLYRIANVEFQGNAVIDSSQLAEGVPLPKGQPYHPVLRERAIRKIQELYWEQGYNDIEMEVSTNRHPQAGTLDVVARITENRQSTIREIVIEGNENTSENLIRTQLDVKPGDVLNLQKLSNSRRNLYNTGAYSVVDITREEIAPGAVRLTVKVRELQPFQVRYGGFYDTERGPGAIVDITNRNSLGSARTLGLRTRYDSQLQEARLYFTEPFLRRFPVSTTASPFIRRERNPATQESDAFNVDRAGFSLQQEAKFYKKYVLNYGYRIEKSRTYDLGPEPAFDISLRVAALTTTLTRESRDDVLDATRGDFLSQAFQFSPESLGSELRFIKYFGQYFRYFPLQKPKVELFTNKTLRPRLVYAAGVRTGLAKGLGGQEIPLSQRFFAGGSTTIRGFQQNSIGPVATGRVPLGGDAMLVINNELRFPLISRLDGVGFVDLGNVYRHVSDFSLTDIRKAGGLGLRVRTPWFLLRLDYGLKLDRRPGESIGRLFFSIGQAF